MAKSDSWMYSIIQENNFTRNKSYKKQNWDFHRFHVAFIASSKESEMTPRKATIIIKQEIFPCLYVEESQL